MALEERNTSSADSDGRVAVADPELVEDPDSDLELREDFAEDLRASLEAVARGDATTRPAEEVAEKFGLSW